MKKLFSNKLFYIIIPFFGLAALPAKAVCPVCVVAVGAGLGLSEYLGIDDTLAGVWIGGLLVALVLWTINWLNKKNWLTSTRRAVLFPSRKRIDNQTLRDIAVFILYYGLTLWPLWTSNIIGLPDNRLWGVDKLLLGVTAGSLGFIGATFWYERIKKRRGRAHFPFQKVAMPVGALIILDIIFYFLTK